MLQSINTIAISILLLSVNGNINAQSKFDSIRIKEASVCGIIIGNDEDCILDKLGKPDSITYSFDEMEGASIKKYKYAKSVFLVSDNHQVIGFQILDSTFLFDFGKLKILDDAEKVARLFPVSYKNRYLNSNNNTIVKVRIGNSDDYCLFLLQENKIIEIFTWRDL